MKPHSTLLVLVSIAAFAGCTRQQIDTASHSLASAAPAAVNDALVVARIEGAFVTIAPDSAVHVAVASHAGNVRLTGRVKNAATRDQFVAAARKIDGVTGVDASLTVDPKLAGAKDAASDFALSVAVQANVAAQAGVNALSVHADAHAGTVTLRGTVATQAIRATVVDAAKHAPGVKKVNDELNVGR